MGLSGVTLASAIAEIRADREQLARDAFTPAMALRHSSTLTQHHFHTVMYCDTSWLQVIGVKTSIEVAAKRASSAKGTKTPPTRIAGSTRVHLFFQRCSSAAR